MISAKELKNTRKKRAPKRGVKIVVENLQGIAETVVKSVISFDKRNLVVCLIVCSS